MKEKFTMVRYSLEQVRAMRERGKDKADPDAHEAESLGVDFWKCARVVMPRGKTSVCLRLDNDIKE